MAGHSTACLALNHGRQAVVFINQRRVGETPLASACVRGSHVVWVEQKGYERWSSSVLSPTVSRSAWRHAAPQPLTDTARNPRSDLPGGGGGRRIDKASSVNRGDAPLGGL
jgi:hypothetical protein